MNRELIELAELAGIGLSLAISGATLALHHAGRRAVRNTARRAAQVEADSRCRWHYTAAGVRMAGLEADSRTHRHALNEHGILDGDRIVPARPEPPTLFRPGAEEAV